ncbi:hypothetical protein H0X10_04570 [Candidatus Saccharibacteria bacterium]|nr:hypothetical protein [Candidatus Saccharibacteria bacterium]
MRQKSVSRQRYIKIKYKKQKIRVLLDKVLIFRFFSSLHGRFWGIAGISMMSLGFAICFAIKPELRDVSTAFSDFGNDVRTAPYFAGSVFVGAYGMWRWRNYLARTWKRTMPVTGLMTLTIFGLYIVALVPISWNSDIHSFGLLLAGISMIATVVFDGLLSKPSKRSRHIHWLAIRMSSLVLIVTGGWLTYGSSRLAGWYNVALLGECLMLLGYLLWVGVKTYQGEGNRSQLSKSVRRIVLID